MADLTRRKFLSRGSVTAVGAVGALSAGPAALAAAANAFVGSGEEAGTDELSALDGPMFVHVRDAATGEIEVLLDETSVVLNDRALVAKLQSATR
jgi:hypothetical protein